MAAAAHLRRLRESLDGPITFGELSARLGLEGVGLTAFLLSLPFLQPVPLAGLGTPVGLMLAALGVQLARGKEKPSLPRFVSGRRLESATVERLLSIAERLMRVVERFARPRWAFAARSPRVYGCAIVVLGLIFATPVFVPFGNPITAAPLVLISLALLEDDGLAGALGVAGTVVTILYHAAFAGAIWAALRSLAARFS